MPFASKFVRMRGEAVSGVCVRRVADLCDASLGDLPAGRHRDAVVAVREHLLDPLRIAVAGRVKAGKSTLVNALIGSRAAPTDVQECTKVVTWFSYGIPERVEVALKNGSRHTLPLTNGTIPDPLGLDLAEVDYVEVYLSQDVLRRATLIDTPGLASLHEEHSARTEELLVDRASRSAARQADALVFLVGHSVRENEAEALEAFNALFEGTGTSPATALAVLTRADQIGGGDGDPLDTAARIAARQAQQLRSVAATVLPVVGLLAETTECRVLEERDALALQELASLDELTRERLLFSHEELQTVDVAVPREQRGRLGALLDLFGIARALELIDTGVRGARSLEDELRNLCGIGELRRLLDETFAQRADALKANAALGALSRISWQAADADSLGALLELRNAVEELRLEPEMRVIGEIWAAQAAAAPETLLSESLKEDVVRLTTEGDVGRKLGLPAGAPSGDVAQAARQAASRWRTYHNLDAATEIESRIARTMYRSFETLAANAEQVGAGIPEGVHQ